VRGRLRASFRAGRRAGRRFRQLDASAPCLGEANGNRLFRRSRAVLAFTDVVDLFTHEFAGLGRRGLPRSFVALRTHDCVSFRHDSSATLPDVLDVSRRSSTFLDVPRRC